MVQMTLNKNAEQVKELSTVLNRQVANFSVMYMKLHHYHWFIKGVKFFELHEKFEELYDEVTAHMDEVAERLLSIGGAPISTLQQCLQDATIQEAAGNENENQMVSAVRQDLMTISEELQQGMETAQKYNDEATSDMLLGIKASFEKHIWMLSSYLGE